MKASNVLFEDVRRRRDIVASDFGENPQSNPAAESYMYTRSSPDEMLGHVQQKNVQQLPARRG